MVHDEKCFPRALTEQVRMPLGIDFRDFDTARDKFRTGRYESSWFSLLANLYGVSRDEIEQRVRARRLRRRTLWSIASSLVTAIVLVFAIVAWIQRDAALEAQAEAELQRGAALQAQAEAEAQVLAMKAERKALDGDFEVALMLASAAVRRVREFPGAPPSPDAKTVIYQAVTEIPGIGLAGWHEPWVPQRSTEPWVATDSSGRWMVTGNFVGNTALLWDLSQEPVAGSARILTGVPDNYTAGRWEDNIQTYLKTSLPEIDGAWVVPPWDDESSRFSALPAGSEYGIARQYLGNRDWVLRQKADKSYWLTRDSDTEPTIVPIHYPEREYLEFSGDRLAVTADNRWLVMLGSRTHRLIELAPASTAIAYVSPITDFQWLVNGQVLVTLHADGSLYRWDANGSAREITPPYDRQHGFRDLVLSGNEQWLMQQHGAGNWSLWEFVNGHWVTRLVHGQEGYRVFNDLVSQGRRLSENRLFGGYRDRSYGVKYSIDLEIDEDGILTVGTPDGRVQLNLSQIDGGIVLLPQTDLTEINTSVESLIPDLNEFSKWPDLPDLGGEIPRLGGRMYPSVYLASKDKHWLVVGASYKGNKNDCTIPLDYYRMDLTHSTPVETWSPLRQNLARDTSDPYENPSTNEYGELYENYGLDDCAAVQFSTSGAWLLARDTLWPGTSNSATGNPVFLPGPGLSINHEETLVAVEIRHPEGLRIQFFPIEPEAIAELACRVAGRNPTDEEWRALFPGQVYTPLCPENSSPPALTPITW